MLQYEFDNVLFQLQKNSGGAVLTATMPLFYRKERQKVTVNYLAMPDNTVAKEIVMPSAPMNPFLVQKINYLAEQYRKIAEGEGGPFEQLKAHFEKRKLNQQIKKAG